MHNRLLQYEPVYSNGNIQKPATCRSQYVDARHVRTCRTGARFPKLRKIFVRFLANVYVVVRPSVVCLSVTFVLLRRFIFRQFIIIIIIITKFV